MNVISHGRCYDECGAAHVHDDEFNVNRTSWKLLLFSIPHVTLRNRLEIMSSLAS